MAPYLSPPLTASNIDLYVVRSSILAALTKQLPEFHGRFLDVGAGNQPYKSLITETPSRVEEYTPLDLHDNFHYENCQDTWDGITMPFKDDTMDCAMATEVLEHCPDPTVTLSEIARVLRPNGLFFFTVPFVWPLHDCPYDEYRYTPWSLQRHLEEAGFTDIAVRPTGGWNAALAQSIGLWVRRSPMSPRRRKLLSAAVFPLYRYLIRNDVSKDSFNHDYCFMPGISGTARVPG